MSTPARAQALVPTGAAGPGVAGAPARRRRPGRRPSGRPFRWPWPLNQPAWRRQVGRFAFWGPLLGGLPYNLFLIGVPFSYALGLVPAAVAGALFGAWRLLPSRRVSGWVGATLEGALCGAAGCMAGAVLLQGMLGAEPIHLLFLLALHGMPAGAALGATARLRPAGPVSPPPGPAAGSPTPLPT